MNKNRHDDGGDLDDREGEGGGEGGGGSKILVDGRRSGRPSMGNTRGPRGPKNVYR